MEIHHQHHHPLRYAAPSAIVDLFIGRVNIFLTLEDRRDVARSLPRYTFGNHYGAMEHLSSGRDKDGDRWPSLRLNERDPVVTDTWSPE